MEGHFLDEVLIPLVMLRPDSLHLHEDHKRGLTLSSGALNERVSRSLTDSEEADLFRDLLSVLFITSQTL